MEIVYKGKSMGALGLKDLRLQGITLAIKWLAKALVGEEHSKKLIRYNLRKGHPCGENLWNKWTVLDFLALDCKTRVGGSNVFKEILKS